MTDFISLTVSNNKIIACNLMLFSDEKNAQFDDSDVICGGSWHDAGYDYTDYIVRISQTDPRRADTVMTRIRKINAFIH